MPKVCIRRAPWSTSRKSNGVCASNFCKNPMRCSAFFGLPSSTSQETSDFSRKAAGPSAFTAAYTPAATAPSAAPIPISAYLATPKTAENAVPMPLTTPTRPLTRPLTSLIGSASAPKTSLPAVPRAGKAMVTVESALPSPETPVRTAARPPAAPPAASPFSPPAPLSRCSCVSRACKADVASVVEAPIMTLRRKGAAAMVASVSCMLVQDTGARQPGLRTAGTGRLVCRPGLKGGKSDRGRSQREAITSARVSARGPSRR